MSKFPAPTPSSPADLEPHSQFPNLLTTRYGADRACPPTVLPTALPPIPSRLSLGSSTTKKCLCPPPIPAHAEEGIPERLSNLPKITQPMKGEAKAGTQAHWPPQTHTSGSKPGAGEPEKYNKRPALEEFRGWSGRCPAFRCSCSEGKSPRAAPGTYVLIIYYFGAENPTRDGVKSFLGWTARGSGRDKVSFDKREPYSASDSPAPPPPISPSAISKANHNEMLFCHNQPYHSK